MFGMSRAARRKKLKEEYRRKQIRSAAWDTDKELTAAAAGRETTWYSRKEYAAEHIGGALLHAAISALIVAAKAISNVFR